LEQFSGFAAARVAVVVKGETN